MKPTTRFKMIDAVIKMASLEFQTTADFIELAKTSDEELIYKVIELADDNHKQMERISELKNEYERIRKYEYDKYDDEFEAMDRKTDIETVFRMLNIDFNKFER